MSIGKCRFYKLPSLWLLVTPSAYLGHWGRAITETHKRDVKQLTTSPHMNPAGYSDVRLVRSPLNKEKKFTRVTVKLIKVTLYGSMRNR